MERLFVVDQKNYDEAWPRFVRPSVRGIVRRGDRIAMIYNHKYRGYIFPGGGIEPGESLEQALVREVGEETGLRIIPESVQEYGSVLSVFKRFNDEIFVQENYFYFCEAYETGGEQKLDAYEAEEGFVPDFVTLQEALRVNCAPGHGEADGSAWFERDIRVLKRLMEENSRVL